jgi:hypothetical protein
MRRRPSSASSAPPPPSSSHVRPPSSILLLIPRSTGAWLTLPCSIYRRAITLSNPRPDSPDLGRADAGSGSSDV